MSTLAEIEDAVPHLSMEELVELEHFVQVQRKQRSKLSAHGLLEIGTVNLGALLQPLGSRDEWHDEMTADRK